MRPFRAVLLMTLSLTLLPTALSAQQIVQSRGYDSRVDYVSLARFEPWDDRNYQLTAEDLELLPENEALRRPRVPLFYRIEMLKERPALRDPLRRYPRSALNLFLGKYGGFLVEGKLYHHVEVEGYTIRVESEKGVKKEDFEKRGHKAFEKANGWNVKPFRQGAETAVKFKPSSSDVAVAGVNDAQFGQTMGFTTNGGRTWTTSTGADPLPNSCCDPTVDWSADGSKAYTATLQADGENDVWVYRSANDGQTWDDLPSGRTEIGDVGTDKEYLHVDKFLGSPFQDRVYLCWHVDNIQRFAYSTDQAETFNTRTVASNSQQVGIGCDITTDKNGRVYYFWPAFNSRRILVRRSVDGGETFQRTRQIARTQADFDYPVPVMQRRNAFVYVSAEADLSDGPYANSIYATWNDTYERDNDAAPRSNHSRIRVAFSRDGGQTWRIRSPHPNDDADSVDRFHPWLAVDGAGVVHVIYYDTQRAADRLAVDVFHAISTDGGESWTRRRATNEMSPRIRDFFQFGDYNGLDAGAARLLATWTENINGEAQGRAGRRNNPPPPAPPGGRF